MDRKSRSGSSSRMSGKRTSSSGASKAGLLERGAERTVSKHMCGQERGLDPLDDWGPPTKKFPLLGCPSRKRWLARAFKRRRQHVTARLEETAQREEAIANSRLRKKHLAEGKCLVQEEKQQIHKTEGSSDEDGPSRPPARGSLAKRRCDKSAAGGCSGKNVFANRSWGQGSPRSSRGNNKGVEAGRKKRLREKGKSPIVKNR